MNNGCLTKFHTQNFFFVHLSIYTLLINDGIEKEKEKEENNKSIKVNLFNRYFCSLLIKLINFLFLSGFFYLHY